MTHPADCLHTTRTKILSVHQGSRLIRTLYTERCNGCSVVFEFTRDALTERHPDGSVFVSQHPENAGQDVADVSHDGGPRGPDDSDILNPSYLRHSL